MLKRKVLHSILLVLLVGGLVGCGDDSEETIPTPPPPLSPPPAQFNPPSAPPADDRLPDLTRSTGIKLNGGNFATLGELVQDLQLPLVGDPLISLNLQNGGDSGELLLALEDQFGFWGALLPVFPTAGTLSESVLDKIFADDSLVVRVIGTLQNGGIKGTIYFRNRAPGETQCIPIQVSCQSVVVQPGEVPPIGGENCVDGELIYEKQACEDYMKVTHSAVKGLGSFEAPVAQWISP